MLWIRVDCVQNNIFQLGIRQMHALGIWMQCLDLFEKYQSLPCHYMPHDFYRNFLDNVRFNIECFLKTFLVYLRLLVIAVDLIIHCNGIIYGSVLW